jgi:two-component system, chemotaxis family, CheB/CheR fusion protein
MNTTGTFPLPLPSHIVGIGASAGGLEAIESFFSAMRPDSGLAFVVIQHLSPDYKSLMVEILSKRTRMKVVRAENGMLVEPDHVYLITPKNNLTIFHGRLMLHEHDSNKGINLPIDVFLKSLAEDQAEKAVGIVLSGTGSDGMRGVRAIKEAGGFVLVQDEESAKFDGMPRSAISTGLADFVMPPEEMPEQLIKFASHPMGFSDDYTEKMVTDEDSLNRIFALLREKHKVDFTYYKMSTVLRRIKRRMTVNGIDSPPDYARYMETSTREVTSLYKELLIGVTSFFRDREAFDLLEGKILPDLLSRKANQEARLWVAGCSTGEEAYTLAMLCKEIMDKLKVSVDLKIFATDVDEEAIARAGNGIYPESIAADLSPMLLGKYFLRKDDKYQIVRSIREMVVFAQHNILKDPPFTNIELISCRNLLIYLQPVLQVKALEFFNFSLNASGILFLGSSESIGEMMEFFDPLDHKWKIFKSRGRKKHPRMLDDYEVRRTRRDHQRTFAAGHHKRHFELDRTLERFLEALHTDLIPVSVIVNEQLEILHLVGDISRFFKVPTGAFTTSITRMAHKELSVPLSTGLQRVFQSRENINYSNIILRIDEEKVNINLRIILLPEKRGQDSLAAVLISINERRVEVKGDEVTQNFDIAEESEQRIYDLEQELQFTRENLQATIEELETSNEELQATNEELLASNEELQSTNEELQSVNEELHTVNAEYQSKIAELSELNNDMDNLLTGTDVGTIFLDENLEIRKYTPQVRKIMEIQERDIERPVMVLDNRLPGCDLLQLVNKVQQTNIPAEQSFLAPGDEAYLVRVHPYVVAPESVSGFVITFVNISNLHKTKEDLFLSERRHRVAAALTSIGYWEIDLDTMQTSWTDEVYKIHELDPGSHHDVEKGIDYYHPGDRDKIVQAVQNCIETGTPFDLELRFITSKGNHRWVRSIGKAQTEQNQITNVYGAIQDITELVQVRHDLAESRVEYRELFDAINSGVVIYKQFGDGDGFLIRDINEAGAITCGVKRDDVINRSVVDVFPNIDQMGLLEVLQKVWKTGEPAVLPATEYRDDKLHLVVENRVYKIPSGDVVAVFVKKSL